MALVAALAPTRTGSRRFIPAETLAEAAGLSMAALSPQIDHLRSLGLSVQTAGDYGCRLAAPFDHLLIPEAVLPLLLERIDVSRPTVVGLPYRYQARCGSTNLLLKEEATGLPSGTVMVTDCQTAGRGRLGRPWSSGPGVDLTFSVLLRPAVSPERAPLLSLAAAVATAEVLETLPGLRGRVWVKWPNDVLVDDKKVCGILLESSLGGERLEWVVIGVGLNVNSDPGVMLDGLTLDERAVWRGKPRPTSLRAELGKEVARGPLLVGLLEQLDLRCRDPIGADVLTRLRSRDALLGRRLEVLAGTPAGAPTVAGEAVGIGPQGELLVLDDSGRTVPVLAGEVTLSVDRSATGQLDCRAHNRR